MAKRISLKHYIKNFNDAKLIFSLGFDMPEEISALNLVVREIRINDIEYDNEWKMVNGKAEMFVEPIDENLPIPQIEQ